jgi:hypothetical protein
VWVHGYGLGCSCRCECFLYMCACMFACVCLVQCCHLQVDARDLCVQMSVLACLHVCALCSALCSVGTCKLMHADLDL